MHFFLARHRLHVCLGSLKTEQVGEREERERARDREGRPRSQLFSESVPSSVKMRKAQHAPLFTTAVAPRFVHRFEPSSPLSSSRLMH